MRTLYTVIHAVSKKSQFAIMVRLACGSATLAQLVEHLIRNEKVAGSIPAGGSRFCARLRLTAQNHTAGLPAEAASVGGCRITAIM